MGYQAQRMMVINHNQMEKGLFVVKIDTLGDQVRGSDRDLGHSTPQPMMEITFSRDPSTNENRA